MRDPVVSIVIPTYNSASTLQETLESIIAQTYPHWEIIIIDGKSIDHTLEIIKKYESHISQWLSEKDNGIYDAMNKGILMSKGDYLYFMGSDDIFYSNGVLERIFTESRYCDYEVIYGNVINKSTGDIYDGEFTVFKLKEKNICHQSIFTNRKLFESLGNFDIKYKALADWDFNLKWFTNIKVKKIFVPEIIALYNDLATSSGYFEQGFYKHKDEFLDRFIYPWYALLYKKTIKFLRNKLRVLKDLFFV
jgi:glycosyltransferase involved in cell wall biosynthesis